MHANLDTLLTAIYVLTDDFLQPRHGPGAPPKITDAELITLAIAQVFLGLPNDRQFLAGQTVIAEEGFAGSEFEAWMADRGANFLRPDRKGEPPRYGSLGRVRQWIESVSWTCKGQLGLERHGARTLPGLCARVGLRLLALAAGLWHNAEIGQPGRSFACYGH